MAYELKNGQGTIFKNTYKQKETHPDYRGEIKTPNGELFEVSLWVKEGQKGKFFSVSVQEPYKKPDGNKSKPTEAPPAPEPTDDENDIPF